MLRDTVPFLPQDANLTSLGIVKVPDGLAEQVGLVGMLYPTRATTDILGAFASSYPDLLDPVVTFNVYVGDLGPNTGVPVSVYALDQHPHPDRRAGHPHPALQLVPGTPVPLPDELGTIELGPIPDSRRWRSPPTPPKPPT